ncbi:hypothetical protein HZU75_01235 [Chitinibacter fontanus]|uniref:Toxin-antitoxin system YwqK family antitoxin n=1 Tax=Chitinibacter fontanus TaxID=1737446 RepID=A0A7D5Z861_9NEIS|nr:hypothetical protein [Chitinibacter fontanus]QLI80265.1 hypothetical protein HZU75_01235 [Chitinibacter fontanus]
MIKSQLSLVNTTSIISSKKINLFFVSTLILLTGCSSKIDCNNSTVKEQALSIIGQELNKSIYYREALPAFGTDFKIENVKTTSKNDEIETGTCNADYSFIYNGSARKLNFSYIVSILKDKGEPQVEVYAKEVRNSIETLVANQEPPIKNGAQVHTDTATGNVIDKLNWKDNKMDGVQEFFNSKNNALILKINFENGTKKGLQQGWSDDGKTLLTELNWVDGKPSGYEKKFIGSKLVTELKWNSGLQTGFSSNYRPGLPMYDETHYQDGKKTVVNEYTSLDNEGKEVRLTKESPYVDNKLNGLVKIYTREGKLNEEIEYKDDEVVSSKSYELGSN